MAEEFPINEVDFVQWVNSLNPNDVLGEVCGESTCPVARFVRYTQDRLVDVGELNILDRTENKEYETPEWASRFVRGFDKAFPDHYIAKVVEVKSALPYIVNWTKI